VFDPHGGPLPVRGSHRGHCIDVEAIFEEDDPAIGEDAVLDTLAEVWLRAIYGTTEPPAG
jgi:hypothetical protein